MKLFKDEFNLSDYENRFDQEPKLQLNKQQSFYSRRDQPQPYYEVRMSSPPIRKTLRKRKRVVRKKTLSSKPKKRTDFFMKITLCGDGAVGKTALRERFLGKGFSSSYLQTIGADFAAHEATIGDKSIVYQIWDLAGQVGFKGVRSTYYSGCFGALLVFDLTRMSSFENLPNWIDEIIKLNGRGPVPMIVLGNKADLKDQIQVTGDQIQTFITRLNEKYRENQFSVPYLTTSALTGLNVAKAFDVLGNNIISWLQTQR